MPNMVPTTNTILDRHVREALHTYLRNTIVATHPTTMLIDEYAFAAGKEEGRADVVAVNSHLYCYEIKSDQDSLSRLKRQIRIYGKAMDYLSVVTTEKHYAGAKRALPKSWGIYVFADGVVEPERFPTMNDKVEARVVAGLLWKETALQLLRQHGAERGFAKKAKHHMHDHLATILDAGALRDAVCQQLKHHRRSL